MKLPKTGNAFGLILFVAVAVQCSSMFGQSESTTRRASETQDVKFPGVSDERSLLAKMMSENSNSLSTPLSTPTGKNFQQSTTSKSDTNDFAPRRFSKAKTNPFRAAKKNATQYPVFPVRTAQNPLKHQVNSQQSQRVVKIDKKTKPIRIANETRARERQIPSTRQTASIEQPMTKNSVTRSRSQVQAIAAAPLVSVLESRTLQPLRSQSAALVPTEAVPRPSAKQKMLIPTEIVDVENDQMGVDDKRPRKILLEAEKTVDSGRLRKIAEEPVSAPNNIFKSRSNDSRNSLPAKARLAKNKPVIDNFSDAPKVNFQESAPNGQGRLIFNRTLNQESGNKSQLKPNDSSNIVGLNKVGRSLGRSSISSRVLQNLAAIEDMESETFHRNHVNSDAPAPARPSKILLNRKNLHDLDASRSTSQADSEPLRIREAKREHGIEMSFGDQQENQPKTAIQSHGLRKPQFERPAAQAEKSSSQGIKKKLKTESQKEVTEDQRRQNYVSHLHRNLATAPVQLSLRYLDDDGNSVSSGSLQSRYLVDFAGFYLNAYDESLIRSDCEIASCAVWVSPNSCHQPLYFEDVNLERYGARYPFFQPGLSGVHFFGSAIRLPYMMALDPIGQCRSSAGYGRPGNKYCYQREKMVWSLKAGSFQALLVTAAVFALP